MKKKFQVEFDASEWRHFRFFFFWFFRLQIYVKRSIGAVTTSSWLWLKIKSLQDVIFRKSKLRRKRLRNTKVILVRLSHGRVMVSLLLQVPKAVWYKYGIWQKKLSFWKRNVALINALWRHYTGIPCITVWLGLCRFKFMFCFVCFLGGFWNWKKSKLTCKKISGLVREGKFLEGISGIT